MKTAHSLPLGAICPRGDIPAYYNIPNTTLNTGAFRPLKDFRLSRAAYVEADMPAWPGEIGIVLGRPYPESTLA